MRLASIQFRFECQPGCVNCCTQSGEVYLVEEDRQRIASHLGITPDEFTQQYATGEGEEFRLSIPAPERCHFLEDGGCSIHAVKPLQCRTFPFWPENVKTKRGWRALSRYCPGIGAGGIIPLEQVRRSADECREAFGDLSG